jgi:hypothetical protein
MVKGPQTGRGAGGWDWFPSAASAVVSVAVAIAFLVLRSTLLDFGGRFGMTPSGKRIFSIATFLVAGLSLLRAFRHGRDALRIYRGDDD